MIIQFQPFYSVFIQFKTRVKNVCWYSKEINSIMVPIRITIKLVSILIKGNDSRDGMAILLFLLGCIGCSTCCHPLVLINVLQYCRLVYSTKALKCSMEMKQVWDWNDSPTARAKPQSTVAVSSMWGWRAIFISECAEVSQKWWFWWWWGLPLMLLLLEDAL